jgi:hypothetical protein
MKLQLMKPLFSLFALTGLLACGGRVANAQLLYNGNLDITNTGPQFLPTPSGWSVNSFTPNGPFNDGCSAETFANVLAPGGFGLFFKPFQGATTNKITVDFYQTVAATAGVSYTLTGWAGAGANYIGLTDSTVQSLFHITFLGSTSNTLLNVTLNLAAAGLGTGAPTLPATGFGYHPFTLSATAPAGTVSVAVGAEMVNAYNNPLGGDQAFVVDSFTLVPEPGALSLAALGMASLLAFRRRR